MDFTTTEDQQALVGLATQILSELSTKKRLDALESWYDAELWHQLAQAGIVGAALKEDVGGLGLGFTELALVLEQVGAHVAQVPLFETVLCAALPIDHFGTPDQRARLLPGVADGSSLIAAALVESGRDDLRRPTVTWREGVVSGTKTNVPLADLTTQLLVSTTSPEGEVALVLVDPADPGVTMREGTGTHGMPLFEVDFNDAPGEVLQGGSEALGWLLDRALTGLAATALGVSGRALRLSATYTTGREQFGRPIATFQAVGHRLADAYIDVEALRLTTLQAVWLLDSGLPGRDEAQIAKWWASEGGHRVAHAAQHVHGGVGIDVEYDLPRYFLWSKHLEFAMGSAQSQLLALGATLAAEPV